MTATATKPSESLITPVAETTALTRWEALAADIAIASQEAEGKVFNYRDKHDNKAARSWIAQLRRLKGGIERARKDAKAVHLERGRAVDEAAKTLEAAVVGLIEPHESAIKALEAEEQARIDAHRAVLDRIAQLSEGVSTADEAEARLAELAAIDSTALEEFAVAGANRLQEAIERLEELRDTLRIQEAERAELEALRAEKARREEEERQKRIRQEAIEQERQRAAEQEARIRREAEERQRASEEQARIEREAAATREAQALAAAEAARRAQEEAEQRAAEAERREQERLAEQLRAEQARADAEEKAQQARKARAKTLQRELTIEMDGMTPASVAAAIANGTLHPAIQVDWSKVR